MPSDLPIIESSLWRAQKLRIEPYFRHFIGQLLFVVRNILRAIDWLFCDARKARLYFRCATFAIAFRLVSLPLKSAR